MSVLRDRQLIVSPGPTKGVVTVGTDVSYACTISFRGRAVSAYSMGKNTLEVGDIVSVVDIDGIIFAVKDESGYPTRYRRPLTDWAPRHPANMLLQMCLRNAKKDYTYRLGVVSAVAGENSLIVECWDGRPRQCPVEYAGELRASSAFAVGEAVVLFQKTRNNWVVVGKLSSLTMTPNSVNFGLVATGSSSASAILSVTGTGLSVDITVTATAPFQVSLNGSSWSDSVTLPSSGGEVYSKFAPSAAGAVSGSITSTSGDASDVTDVAGSGFTPAPLTPSITLESTWDLASVPLNTRIPIVIRHTNISTPSTVEMGAGFIGLSTTIDGPGLLILSLPPLGTGTTTIYMYQGVPFGGAPSPQPYFAFINAEGFLPFPFVNRNIYFKNV